MGTRVEHSRFRPTVLIIAAALLLWQPPFARAAGDKYAAAVGKIKFGTSTVADALRILGDPLEYRPFNSHLGKLSPDDLPDNYVMVYPDGLEVAISRGEVDELAFFEPSYAFRDAVQVGSTLDEVLEAVGQPLTTMLGHSGFCHTNILYKDYGGEKGSCVYRRQDLGVLFRFRDYRVSEMCLNRPEEGESHDYRWIDLSQVDIPQRLIAAEDLEFNSATIWPPKNKLPRGFDPQKLLKAGMNPGLGVRALHERGITGRGVNVAMIDQPLLQDHPEFEGKIAAYYDTTGYSGSLTSTHGPGMASLLVGTNCGTAPGARLYYAAAPSWRRDASYYARALDWIIEQSAKLPDSEKIRVVSVSAAPSGRGSPFTQNNEMWDEACARAAAANILVLDCTSHQGIISRAFYDADDPDNVSKCQPGVPGDVCPAGPERVCAPACPRTKADQSDDDGRHTNGYTYVRRGGLSSSIPYTAGVLALGWQVRPELSAQQMRDILFQTAHASANGANIINPPELIDFVQSGDVSTVRSQARAGRDAYNDKVAQLDLESATADDVRRIFGEPFEYRWMRDTFSPDNLPERYAMMYPGGVEIDIERGRVRGLEFHEANYSYRGSVRVGSPLDEVIQVVGEPAVTRVGWGSSGHENILHKDLDGDVGRCCYYRADQGLKIWFRDYKVVMIQLFQPETTSERSQAPKKRANSREHDHRGADLREYDFSDQKDLPEEIVFNQSTIWPPKDRMPPNADPQKLLQGGTNPGLGVRAIHQRGITGKGVNIAIIDQPLRPDHPEFSGKIAAYINLCDKEAGDTSMHGPAVASLLVGTQCGTAPGARLYYAAAPSWTKDSAYYARALDWIIEQNAQLPDSEKIRAVSVSAAPSGQGSPFDKNHEMWDEACARAKAAGIMVLDCSNTSRGIIGPCWYDPSDPENVAGCTTGFPGREFAPEDGVCAPCSHRTTAEQGDRPGQSSYIYWGRGGMSWSIPYATGVLALGWEIRPDLSPERMRELLMESAYRTPSGSRVIDPQAFIRAVEESGQRPRRTGRQR